MKIHPLILALLVACLTFGCKSPEAVAYKSIGGIAITVDAALSAFGDYYDATMPTATPSTAAALEKRRAQLGKSYQKYQDAMIVAQRIVSEAQRVPEEQRSFQDALNVIAATASDVVSLVESWTGKKVKGKL